jgi:hypothetical protein
LFGGNKNGCIFAAEIFLRDAAIIGFNFSIIKQSCHRIQTEKAIRQQKKQNTKNINDASFETYFSHIRISSQPISGNVGKFFCCGKGI